MEMKISFQISGLSKASKNDTNLRQDDNKIKRPGFARSGF